MSKPLAAAIAGVAGGVLLVIVLLFTLWFFVLRHRRRRSNSPSSGTVSSDPSIQAGTAVELGLTGGVSELSGLRRVSLEELNTATKNFSSINLIGSGTFGEVYKGILYDRTIVAIKRRPSDANEAFVQEIFKVHVCWCKKHFYANMKGGVSFRCGILSLDLQRRLLHLFRSIYP